MKHNYLNFASNLKKIREENKMTQMRFSQIIGCTQAVLSAYENGSKKPSVDFLMSVSDNFKVSIDWLLGLSPEKNLKFEINTYADVAKFFIHLGKKTDIRFKTESVNLDVYMDMYDRLLTEEKRTVETIYFNDKTIDCFLFDWHKMSTLLENGTIDDELFDLWAEKTQRSLKNENVSCGNYYTEVGDLEE